MITRPFDKIGQNVQDCGSLQLALKEHGLDYKVTVESGFFRHILPDGQIMYHQAPGHNYIVREDNQLVLGTCKERYVPQQNIEAVSIFQPLLDTGLISLDRVGTFGGGEKLWIVCKLEGEEHVVRGEDRVMTHALIINGHDGTTPLSFGLIPTRVWCSNMLVGLGKYLVKVKHTENASELVKFFQLKLTTEIGKITHFVDGLKIMAAKELMMPLAEEYFRKVFEIDEKATTKSENKIKRLLELFQFGQGNQMDEVKGTWYAGYNAVTEYLNYEAGRTDESRLRALWFGANAGVAERAYRIAYDMSQ